MERFHDFLKRIRIGRGLSIRALTQGLCSPSTYHAIESGKSIPDPSLLKLLVERLGVSFNIFELIIDKKTYKKELMFSKICLLIESGKTTEAEDIIKSIDPNMFSGSVDRMLYHRLIAWLKYVETDYTGAKEAIKSAISETLFHKIENIQNLQNLKAISSTEIENVLFLLNLSILESRSGIRSVFLSDYVLDMIKAYLKHANLDSDEYAVIYPKLWYIESQMALLEGDEKKAVSLSIKAIRVLRKAEIYYLVPSFLDIIVMYGKDVLLSKRYTNYNEFNNSLNDLIDRIPFLPKNCNPFFSRFRKTIYHLDYEIIRGERKKAISTQSGFMGSAYTEESSLSRIENGSRSMRTSKLDVIMEKCNINKSRINIFPLYGEYDPVNAIKPIKSLIRTRTLFYDELLRVTALCRSLVENNRSDEAEAILSDALTRYESSDLSPVFHFVPFETLRTFLADITQNPRLAFENIKYSLVSGSLHGIITNYKTISSIAPFCVR